MQIKEHSGVFTHVKAERVQGYRTQGDRNKSRSFGEFMLILRCYYLSNVCMTAQEQEHEIIVQIIARCVLCRLGSCDLLCDHI